MPDYFASPALRRIGNDSLLTIPLTGVEAQIYDRIWRAVVEGKLKSGTKLREEVLTETFGVSRTIVRKVLIILEQEGIAHLPLNRGAYVATPSATSARAVLEAFHMVASYIARELGSPGRLLTESERDLFDLHIRAQAEAEGANDFVTSRLLTGEFYVLMAAVHGNEILTQQASNLFTRYLMGLSLYQVPHQHFPRAAIQREIVDLLAEGKADEAEARVLANFTAVERTLRFEAVDEIADLREILLGEQRPVRSAIKEVESASQRSKKPASAQRKPKSRTATSKT